MSTLPSPNCHMSAAIICLHIVLGFIFTKRNPSSEPVEKNGCIVGMQMIEAIINGFIVGNQILIN